MGKSHVSEILVNDLRPFVKKIGAAPDRQPLATLKTNPELKTYEETEQS